MFYRLYLTKNESNEFEGETLQRVIDAVAQYGYYQGAVYIDRVEVEDDLENIVEVIDGLKIQAQVDEEIKKMQDAENDFLGVIEAAKEAVNGL